jgi:hypothetical protein
MKDKECCAGDTAEGGQPDHLSRLFSLGISMAVLDDQELEIDERTDDERDRTGGLGKPDQWEAQCEQQHVA